jgi:hypothetical protein
MSPIERFLAKVDLTAGPANCQPWTGSRKPAGYGEFYDGQRVVGAHRWILGYLRGRPLGPGERGLHHCDWPPCVNPLHLYVGTQKDNIRDAIKRGRFRSGGGGHNRGVYTAQCGTKGGYSHHIHYGEPTCRACRDAENAYQRARRAAARTQGEEQ